MTDLNTRLATNHIIKEIERQTISKRSEYEKAKMFFESMVKTRINTSDFEKNAINALSVMLELKTELREIKKIEMKLKIMLKD